MEFPLELSQIKAEVFRRGVHASIASQEHLKQMNQQAYTNIGSIAAQNNLCIRELAWDTFDKVLTKLDSKFNPNKE